MADDQTEPDEVSFGPFRLDRRNRRLIRGEAVTALGSRACALLCTLIEAGGSVVSKTDLLDRVWPGQIVEENNLQVQISALRKALGGGWISNLPGRGYQLLVPALGTGPALPRVPEGRPTLAVLPLENLSEDPDQGYLADALTEEITITLSRVRWFLVVSRRSAYVFKGQSVRDVREIGRALGARYVLEGSVRRAGQRIRLTGSLIEAETGLLLWSDRYEGNLADVFALQDQLSEAVAGAIEPVLRNAEISRARARPTDKLDAYDLYLRSLPLIWAGTRDSYAQALATLRRAIAADPEFALAKASLAFAVTNMTGLGWADRELRAEGGRLAAEALTQSWDDPEVLKNAGHALAFLAGNCDLGLAALNRALVLNPNSVRSILSAGWVQCYRLEPRVAVELFERALRLSPLDPEIGYTLSGLGLAHLIAGEPDAALAPLRRATQEVPTWTPALQFLVVALQWLGRAEEARGAATQLMALMPKLRARPDKWVFRSSPFLDRFLRALEEAGVPG